MRAVMCSVRFMSFIALFFLLMALWSFLAEEIKAESPLLLNNEEVRLFSIGYNAFGQLGLGDKDNRNTPSEVLSLSNVTKVSVGGSHALALTDDGQVYSFGNALYGKLGLGEVEGDISTPTKIPGLDNAKDISAYGSHSLVLLQNGDVYSFGHSMYGQIGLGDTTMTNTPTKIPNISKAKAVVASNWHSLILLENGDVYAFGYNQFGQLGVGEVGKSTKSPTKVPGLANVKEIAAGESFSIALLHNGDVYSFGNNFHGQLGLGDSTMRSAPQKIPNIPRMQSVAAGAGHTLLLSESGEVYAFGANLYGALGTGNNENALSPVKLQQFSNVKAIAAGGDYSLLISDVGEVYAFGDNRSGQLGFGDQTNRLSPAKIPNLMQAASVFAGSFSSFIITNSNEMIDRPEIVYTSHGSGSKGRPLDAEMIVQFDRRITGSLSNIQLKNASGQPIPRSISTYVSKGSVGIDGFKIIPNAPLSRNTTYTIEIPSGVIADFNTPSATFAGTQWSFTTLCCQENIPFKLTADIKKDANRNDEGLVSVHWDDAFFEKDATYYNHDIAKVSMAFSAAAYPFSGDNNTTNNIKNALALPSFNFENLESKNYGNYDGYGDHVGYTFGSKKIQIQGEESNLFVIVIRGTHAAEWLSNFNLGCCLSQGTGRFHQGFYNAAWNVTQDFVSYLNRLSANYDLSKSKNKVLITGHSRGGAVANIVSWQLGANGWSLPGKSETIFDLNNVYAYTFATPNVAEMDTALAESYRNIYNFIHYDDFVPIMPLKEWGFNRHGYNLVFPRSEESALNSEFTRRFGTKFVGYNSSSSIRSFEQKLASAAPRRSSYYNELHYEKPWQEFGITPHGYFRSLSQILIDPNSNAGKIAVGELTSNVTSALWDSQWDNILEPPNVYLSKLKLFHISQFFILNSGEVIFKPTMAYSHAPETYISWLNALPHNWIERGYVDFSYNIKVASPVDVFVYDEDGQLVGSVIGTDVNIGIDNPVEIYLEGEHHDIKVIKFPAHKTFNIQLEGTDTGEMTYTTSIVDDDGEVIASKVYKNVALEKGKQMFSEVSTVYLEEEEEQEQIESSLYAISESGDVMEIQEDGMETPAADIIITANSSGGGLVTGGGKYDIDAEVELVATPSADYAFAGWYEDGARLEHESLVYSFTAETSRRITANFIYLYQQEEDDINAAANHLEIVFASSDSALSVTQDLSLPTSGLHETTIAWISSDEHYVTADGKVTRPSYEEGDKSISLIAVITKGDIHDSKLFPIVVAKLEESPPVTDPDPPPAPETPQPENISIIYIGEEDLERSLQEQGDQLILTLAFDEENDAAAAVLDGASLRSLQERNAHIEMATSRATFKLLVNQLNFEAILPQFGESVNFEDIVLRIEITVPDDAVINKANRTAAIDGYSIVAAPLNFTVMAVHNEQTIEISQFSSFVERTIVIPAGVDIDKTITAVVVEADETLRHVPTRILIAEGKRLAKVQSLTNSTYMLIKNDAKFSDVEAHWAKEAINEMGSRLIVHGVGDNRYHPQQLISRAEFTAMIVRALGIGQITADASFSDVSSTEWYHHYIQAAFGYDLIHGFENGTFLPNEPITREQAMIIVARMLKLTALNEDIAVSSRENMLSQFSDVDAISSWAIESISEVIGLEIITGRDASTLAPKAYITRAEMAVMIQRLLQKTKLI